MATCNSVDSVLEAAEQIRINGGKLNDFVNGDATKEVQLGSGAKTPSLRKFMADAENIKMLAANQAASTVVNTINDHEQNKADKVSDAVEGHLAALDDTGNLTDSGIAAPTITQDDEFIRRVNDEDGNFLFGIRYDGTVEWMDGVPMPLKRYVEKVLKYDAPAGGFDIFHILDSKGRSLFSIGKDGAVEWSSGVPEPVKDFIEQNCKNVFLAGGFDVFRVADAQGKTAFSIGKDGSVEWNVGVPSPVKDYIESYCKHIFVPVGQNVFRIVDSDNKTLFSIGRDGSIEWSVGVPAPVRELCEKFVHVRRDVASPFISTLEDASGKAVQRMDSDGNSKLCGNQDIEGSMKLSGELVCDKIKGVLNWSKASSIKIPELPKCAVVNIKGFSRPLTKADERHAVMEFWDGRGNYFEKNVLIGLQGNSTWNLPKPNYKFDIINGDWNDLDDEGDLETCKIQFGEWVPGDSFHLKAFWTDFTKCRAIVSYKIWDEINKTYGYDKDATWKRAMLPADPYAPNGELPAFSCTHDLKLRMDTGATCRFGAFPCLVYHNGEFYGIFAWQQKKQRQNFQMNKKNFLHIHLDGFVASSLCAGGPDYNAFEVRNPKKLVCWDGSDYDGDLNRQRLITPDDAAYKNKSKFTNTVITDTAIRAIAGHLVELGEMDKAIQAMIAGGQAQADIDAAVASFRETFETYFDPENVIDLVLHVTWDNDGDSTSNNTQWTTWDGVKWYLNRYDANGAFGGNSRWHSKPGNVTHVMGGTAVNHPFHFVEAYYFSELCARYAELRRLRILDADHFISLTQEWMLSVGFDYYEKEFEMWPMQNCLGEMKENSNSWVLVRDSDGNPIRCDGPSASAEDRALPTFNLNATYQNGDVVKSAFSYWYRPNVVQTYTATGYWKVRCVASGPCNGIPPFDTRFINAPDSVYRLYNFIKLRQEKVDAFFGYVS